MRGKALTPAYQASELSLIFFKIRATRDKLHRRSLMRRARLALAARTDLTPAEQHEVMTVWSRADVQHIDSPALRKLLRLPGTQAREWEVQPAQQHRRASFDADGQRLGRVKKPGHARLDFGPSANDDGVSFACRSPSTSPHCAAPCTRAANDAHALFLIHLMPPARRGPDGNAGRFL